MFRTTSEFNETESQFDGDLDENTNKSSIVSEVSDKNWMIKQYKDAQKRRIILDSIASKTISEISSEAGGLTTNLDLNRQTKMKTDNLMERINKYKNTLKTNINKIVNRGQISSGFRNELGNQDRLPIRVPVKLNAPKLNNRTPPFSAFSDLSICELKIIRPKAYHSLKIKTKIDSQDVDADSGAF